MRAQSDMDSNDENNPRNDYPDEGEFDSSSSHDWEGSDPRAGMSYSTTYHEDFYYHEDEKHSDDYDFYRGGRGGDHDDDDAA